GAATPDQADAVAAAASSWAVDIGALATASEGTGSPVAPLVDGLRTQLDDTAAAAVVHRGLTSQDILDTALILIARAALDRVVTDTGDTARSLALLAEQHRDSVMVGRTLTQHAVPTTFGLVAAQWLVALVDARDRLVALRSSLPVQCGGAAGTRSLI